MKWLERWMRPAAEEQSAAQTPQAENAENIEELTPAQRADRLILPLLALRGVLIYPNMSLHFDVGRDKSVKSLKASSASEDLLFLVAQKDASKEEIGREDIYEDGTIVHVKHILKLPGNTLHVLVEGIRRARIVKWHQDEPVALVELDSPDEQELDGASIDLSATIRLIRGAFERLAELTSRVGDDMRDTILEIEAPVHLVDLIAANALGSLEDKQAILAQTDALERFEMIYSMLLGEIEIAQAERRVNQRVRKSIEKHQKEHFLREQVRAIQHELGEAEAEELDDYRKRIGEANLPDEAREKALKEVERLSKSSPMSPENGIIRTYLDWILDLPWHGQTEDNLDIRHAQSILNQDHYGLDKVKDRVLEYLAVRRLVGNMKGSILCFVGPPGVGKTSVAKSIARAMGRKFVRMSLGGVRDEAEIRGHRRTYIGAIPGRILSSMKLAGTNNPVFLLDELDKMSSDFRGDPASAMLEVLDSEQNFAFRDHYLELPFDLSNVMFLATANTLDTVPSALRDRLEVIEVSGYTREEKLEIARNFLMPKQLKTHGLLPRQLRVDDQAILSIIDSYTREAGVRQLERMLAGVCRKAARALAETERKRIQVRPATLQEYLGIARYKRLDAQLEDPLPGFATGLAWTAVGGETLCIEAIAMDGSGKLKLTGQLGEVMKESAMAGVSLLRAHADEFDIPSSFHKDTDIHIHIPEGAIPKDGPSAGITMSTAILSALSGRPVRPRLAMTGEITLRGRVLPVGGIKEKVLAAHRAGVETVLLPRDNERDLQEIPESIRKALRFELVDRFTQVVDLAFEPSAPEAAGGH